MAKVIEIGGKVAIGLVAIYVLGLLFGWWSWGSQSADNDRRGSQQYQSQNTGRQNPRIAPRENLIKKKYLADCDAEGAPVTQLGGGAMNCYRAPTVTTFRD